MFSKIQFFLSKLSLLKNPLFTFVYTSLFFFKNAKLGVSFYNEEAVISAIRSGKSIIRMGDGDMVNIQLGWKNGYHYDSPRLRQMYREIIASYSKTSPYILGVPIFINESNESLRHRGPGKLNWGLRMKAMFLLTFSRTETYMDAHSFYYDNYFERVIYPCIADKKIIFITRKETINSQKEKNTLPWKDMAFIETPSLDALVEYKRIKDDIDSALKNVNPKDVVLLCGMGPVGKYLVYEYARHGYQGLDIGKVIEVMFTGESIAWYI
jgi:hypothetical protein